MTNLICCAKRIDTKEWVEGYVYIPTDEIEYALITKGTINKRDNYVVFRDTVRYYSGLDDIHGRKVFEQSIIEYTRSHNIKAVGKIVFYKGAFMIEYTDEWGDTEWAPLYRFSDIKVIGNTFDNPKLLEA